MEGKQISNRDISVEIIGSLSAINAQEWDACADLDPISDRPLDPFTTYRFLRALEDSGSVGEGTGWQPLYMIARDQNQIIGAAPMYLKSHSQGEYIFDHNWAHAYERAGGRYYPKLQLAAPFTPATGRRFLTKSEHHETAYRALIEGACQFAQKNQISSLHTTFCTQDEYEMGGKFGLLQRETQQFHWCNQRFNTFDDFLGALASRKRKNIRKERATAQAFGGRILKLTSEQIEPNHWDVFWQFYQDTGARKWGTPYLKRAFFDEIQETMRDDLLLVLAENDQGYVAGALNFIGRDALYGRYWGCIEDHPCLHFELCYYQAIDFAIEHGLSRVEAGAQGEHKLARGYMPSTTYSLHWINDPGFDRAVREYLVAERDANQQDIEILTSYGPFRRDTPEETE